MFTNFVVSHLSGNGNHTKARLLRIGIGLPSGKRLLWKIHPYYSWVNQRTKWPCLIIGLYLSIYIYITFLYLIGGIPTPEKYE